MRRDALDAAVALAKRASRADAEHTTYKVVAAHTMRKGKETRDGFDLFVDGKWHERYPTKREAEADGKRLTT